MGPGTYTVVLSVAFFDMTCLDTLCTLGSDHFLHPMQNACVSSSLSNSTVESHLRAKNTSTLFMFLSSTIHARLGDQRKKKVYPAKFVTNQLQSVSKPSKETVKNHYAYRA